MKRPDRFLRLSVCLAITGMLGAAELRTADLVPHLDSPRAEERFATLKALAEIGDAAAITAGIACARKQDNLTIEEIRLLGRLLAFQDITRTAALLEDPDKDLVAGAIADLGLRAPEPLLPIVKGLLGRGERERKLVQNILELALRQPGTTPAYAELALVQFTDPEPYRRQSAVRSLARLDRIDRSVVDHLRKDASPVVRSALVEILSQHRSKAKAAKSQDVPWLEDAYYAMAEDPANEVRHAFYKLLSDQRQELNEAELKRHRAIAIKGFDDPMWQIRSTLLWNFRNYPEVIARIEKFASDTEGVVASVALDIARSLKLPNLGELAFKACSLPHPQNRWVAIEILQQVGDPRMVAVATRLLDDPDSTVRYRAQEALAKSNVGADAGGVALAKAANLKPAERQALLVRMAQADPAERLNEVARLYDGMTPPQRRQLMETLTRDRQLAAGVGEFLLARTADKEQPIVLLAFEALRNLSEREGTLGLLEAMVRLKDPDPKIAAAADSLLKQVLDRGSRGGGGRFESIIPSWEERWPHVDYEGLPPIPTFEEIPAFITTAEASSPMERGRYYKVLAGVDDSRVQALLEKSARSKDRAIRWAALDALVRRGDQSDAALDHALARLLTTKPEDWQTRAIWPATTPRLQERLATFKKLVDDALLESLRTEIDRRLAAMTPLEPVR